MAKKIEDVFDFFVLLEEAVRDGQNLRKASLSEEEARRALLEVFYEILEERNNIKSKVYN